MQIPGFEMLEKLGQGGMATVWKARQVSLDRIVAIKILSSRLARDPADIERFQKEAQSAAKLKHPGIVQVYDANISSGVYFFVMEYVAGYTVGEWVRRKQVLPEKDALLVVECVADALEYAWNRERIIHCDIKPDNVMIDADGTVKVSDLGLARTIRGMSPGQTDSEVMGTPAYMSPEQASGRADLDFRADIYSLGAMLYHLVTGTMLFAGQSEEQVMEQQIAGTVPDPADIKPSVSGWAAVLIETMLAKNREDRHASWAAAKADIARVKKRHMPSTRLLKEGASTVQRSHESGLKIRPKTGRDPSVSAATDTAAVSTRSWMPYAIAGGILALLVVVSLVLRSRSEGTTRKILPLKPQPSVPKIVSDTGSTPPTPMVAQPGPNIESARQVYEAVKAWEQTNPERRQESLERYEQAARQLAGTPYAASATDDARRIRDRLRYDAQQVLAQLQQRVRPLIQESRYEDAARLFETYAGPLARETEPARVQLAEQARQMAHRAVAEREANAKRSSEQFTIWRRDLVDRLVAQGIPPALETARNSVSDETWSAQVTDIQAVVQCLETASQVEQRVADSFREQKGQEITVRLVSGTCKLNVDGVEPLGPGDWKISGHEQMRTSGPALVSLNRSFTLRDLSTAERLLRMGNDTQPEVALHKGLMALAAKAFGPARDAFAKISPVLRDDLLAKVERIESEQAESGALDALKEILRVQGVVVSGNDLNAWEPSIRSMSLTPDRAIRLAEMVKGYRNRFTDKAFLDRFAPVLSLLDELALANERPPKPEPEIPVLTGGNDPLTPDQLLERLLAANAQVLREEIVISTNPDGQVRELRVISREVSDLSALSGMRNLSVLHCGAVPMEEFWRRNDTCRVTSIAALRGLPLEVLYLGGCRIKDLSPIKGLPLKTLDIRDTDIEDLTAINAMDIETLNISRCRVKELGVLRTLRHLRRFNANGIRAYDFKALTDRDLVELDLSDTQFKDAAALRNMRVRSLNLGNTKVYEFGFLRDMPLERLTLTGTQLKDLTLLTGKSLQYLHVSGTGISDLGPLRGMPLRELYAGDTGVKDLSVLNAMPLGVLEIPNTRVTDLAALKGLPLRRLVLAGTAVASLTPLEAMELQVLDISRTKVQDIGLIRRMPLREFRCNDTKVGDYSILRRMAIVHLGIDDPQKRTISDILWSMPNLRTVNYTEWRRK